MIAENGLNFNLEQRQIQFLREEKSPKRAEDIRRTILTHIQERNSPAFDRLIKDLEFEFNTDDPQKKIELIIAGLTKTGKSSLIEGLLSELPGRLSVPVLYQCFEHSRQIAYNLGVINSSVGMIKISEYKKTALIDDIFMRLFYELNGRFLLLREAILLTEDFDVKGKIIGVPRGSLVGVRERIRIGFPVKIIFLEAREEFRRENAQFWESMRVLSPERILEEEAKAGVWDDTIEPEKAKAKYETANLKASLQHIFALTYNTFVIIRQLHEWGKSYEGDYIDDLSLKSLSVLVKRYPSVFDRFRERTTNRVGEGLFGDARSSRVYYLENTPLPKGYLRSASRLLHEEHLLMKELQRQSSGNTTIRNKLGEWGVIP